MEYKTYSILWISQNEFEIYNIINKCKKKMQENKSKQPRIPLYDRSLFLFTVN